MSATDVGEQSEEGAGRPARASTMARRRLVILSAAVAIGLGGGFLVVHQNRVAAEARLAASTKFDAAQPPWVDVVTVEPAPPRQSLMLPGETAAWYDSRIYARVSGYVKNWYVDIGDRVTAGEALATIDTPELDAQLVAAKAKLSVSEADVSVKQAQLDFAKTTYERWRESPKGVVSEQEREDKKAGNAEAAAELNAARAQVSLDQAEVDRLTALTNFKRVQAPFDGTVTERQIDLGDLVTAGSIQLARNFPEHHMRTSTNGRREARRMVFAIAALAASAGAASAMNHHPVRQPAKANRYYGLYDNPVQGLTPQQIDHRKYDRSGTRGREGLGESPFHPEGPGNVSD